jgi:hypothetical protein
MLKKDGLGCWVAQRMLNPLQVALPVDDTLERVPQYVVLGSYVYGALANGMLLRASHRSKVVNVSNGKALIGWAAMMDATAVEELVRSLRDHRDTMSCE